MLQGKIRNIFNEYSIKLPKVEAEDFSYELYSNIDLDSYRLQVKENTSIYLTNDDSELKPVGTK